MSPIPPTQRQNMATTKDRDPTLRVAWKGLLPSGEESIFHARKTCDRFKVVASTKDAWNLNQTKDVSSDSVFETSSE